MTSDWKEYKIEEICEVLSAKRIFASDYVKNGIPFYRSKEIIQKSLGEKISDFLYISENKFNEICSKYGSPQEADILISAVGERAGIPYLVQNEKFYFKDGNLIWLRRFDKARINSDYLCYWFKSNTGQKSLDNLMIGSAQKALTIIGIKGIKVLLPPLKVQQKIAKVLSAIDDKIELNNKINENLEQQIKALYNNSFKNLYEIVDISSLIDVRDGTHDSPKPKATGKKLITSKHLLKYGIDKTSANLISEIDYKKINERSQVITNDILISMIGTVGVVSLVIENPVDFCVKNVGIFRTSQAPELTYYIHCFLNSGKTQNYIHSHLAGTTQKYISLAELRTLKTPVPTKDELKNFNKLVEPIYNKLVNNTQENKNLTQLRDTLLPKLMSGEVDVKNINL